jgi:hypothetical protein
MHSPHLPSLLLAYNVRDIEAVAWQLQHANDRRLGHGRKPRIVNPDPTYATATTLVIETSASVKVVRLGLWLLRLPRLHRPPLRSSLASAYLPDRCSFFAGLVGPATARAQLRARSVCDDGSPAPRCSGFSIRRGLRLPGYWVVFFMRAATMTPRPVRLSLALYREQALLSSGARRPRHRKSELSRLYAAAHMLTCLRINAAVTDNAARLATDLPGSALVGRVSHPLDDFSEF